MLLFRAVPHRRGERYPQRGLPRELGAIGPLQLVVLHWDKAHPAPDYIQKPVCSQPHSPTACSGEVLPACSVTGWFGSGWLRGLGMKMLRSPFLLCTFLLVHPSDFLLEKKKTVQQQNQESKEVNLPKPEEPTPLCVLHLPDLCYTFKLRTKIKQPYCY